MRFSELQAAYEVLSDEQERAWYDTHKASLVPEPDVETVLAETRKGASRSRVRDRGLTKKHLESFFSPTLWVGYGDDENGTGFYSLFRNLFDRLANEERVHGSDIEYPGFGRPDWPWSSPDKSEEKVTKVFYAAWSNFSTAKDFSWLDFSATNAPDRRTRRYLEKENQKVRENARREYVETVKNLVKFIRKRDPRYKAHQKDLASAPTTRETMKSSSTKPAVNPTSYIEQEWQKMDSKYDDDGMQWAMAEGDMIEWECVACRKSFKSEASWDSHERSKKHMKQVALLQREMEEEEALLGLEAPNVDSDADEHNITDAGFVTPPSSPSVISETLPSTPCPPSELSRDQHKQDTSALDQPLEGELSSPRSRLETAQDVTLREAEATSQSVEADAETEDQPKPTKREKRRNKQATKDAQSTSTIQCNACGECFSSRTKLFSHIRTSGHAAGAADQEPPSKKSNRKR